MTHLQLHAEIPGQAIVLVAGCDKELSEVLSTEILNLGHRAFRWDSEISSIESLSREEWHVCLCGPTLSESDRLAIAGMKCQFTRVIVVGAAAAKQEYRTLHEHVPADLSSREWRYLLRSAIEGALATEQLLEWRHRIEKSLFRSLVNHSAPMRSLCRELFSLAESDAPLVFTSESGVDAHEVAWCVHESSRRSRASFLTIDCAGFSSEAFESELFEVVPANGSSGLLENLDGGTLHLKNVQTLSQLTQKKLLRFMESPALSRGDSFSLRYINLRWIVSCHHEKAASNAHPLLQYLHARSDVRAFELPSLRDRREDIPELSRKILD
ncbi:MAG TPA: sigma 54-interacting transcriptional regulator, partial [Planctomycetaceae bacterium]|nr:sigma 54-interacting transcriptional regulator [Planctomycetaceae bacterium]